MESIPKALVMVPESMKSNTNYVLEIRTILKNRGYFSYFIFFRSKPETKAIRKRSAVDLLAIVDQNLSALQFSAMLDKLDQQDEIVVANIMPSRGFLQKLFKNTEIFFFEMLFGIRAEAYPKAAVYRAPSTKLMSETALDNKFLIQSRNAGFKISSIDLDNLSDFKSGISFKDFFSRILSLFKMKLDGAEVVPFNPVLAKAKGKGFYYRSNEFVHYQGPSQNQSAFKRLSNGQIAAIILIVSAIVLAFAISWRPTLIVLIALITVIYFLDLVFNVYLIIRTLQKDPEIKFDPKDLVQLDENLLPTYTIFCPMYKESEVLSQFVSAITRLDYPTSKLQVLLLLEESDHKTIEQAKAFALPDFFEILIVPDSKPKTKPKACNYGLMFAKGEFSVIYDAEDVPEPQQLKKAVLAFKGSDLQVACVQAKLNFYNPHQNILTKIFTAEYALWFDLVLSGLQSIGAPIPLGGTSNHFRTAALKKVGGWDAFNVTEDCDLGMRLAANGYRTAMIDSLTLEEANSQPKNWMEQRSRWVKGYIQTYLVLMRRPGNLFRKWKHHFLTFQFVVGGKIFSMFINPMMWALTLMYFAMRSHFGSLIESFFPTPVLYMAVPSLVIGNFIYMYSYMIGCAKHKDYGFIKYAFFVPLYWLGMSVAAWLAFARIIRSPHEWSKTKHGFHLASQRFIDQAEILIGSKLVNSNLANMGKST